MTDEQLKHNIRMLYKDTANPQEKDDGKRFYHEAHLQMRALAAVFSIDPGIAAGVMAALSPGIDYKRNLVQAAEFIAAYWQRKQLPDVGAYGKVNQDKAQAILDGVDPIRVLGGSRVRGFYSALIRPVGEVAPINRYNFAAAYGEFGSRDAYRSLTANEANHMLNIYLDVAKELEIPVTELQATISIVWKRVCESPF